MKQIAKFLSRSVGNTKIPSHVFSWGKSDDGRLGHNNLNPSRHPRRMPSKWFGNRLITDIFSGYTHTFAIAEDSSVFCWGNNWCGQLGIGDEDNCLGPYLLEGGIWDEISHIACGENHTLATTTDGSVYSWGTGGNLLNQGGLGHGNKKNELTPKLIESLPDNEYFIQVAAGRYHSGALTESGYLYTFGRGDWGRLGHGKVKNEKIPVAIDPSTYMQKGTCKIKKIEFGAAYSSFVTDTDLLFTFGKAENFVLGVDSSNTLISGASMDGLYEPSEVTFFSEEEEVGVVDVACGVEMTACITTDGDVWAWGKSSMKPFKVEGLLGRATSISMGNQHLGIVTENGSYMLGTTNLYGQLGIGEEETGDVRVHLSLKELHKIDENEFIPRKITKFACGEDFTVAIMGVRS